MRNHWKVSLAVGAAAVLALVLAVVFWYSRGSKPLETMTQDAAEARVDDHIKAAVDSLPQRPRLEPSGSVGAVPCDDVPNLRDRHEVERNYWLRDLSISNADVFAALRRYWTSNG